MPHVSIISCLNITFILLIRFDGEFCHSADSSSYSHKNTFGMANYLGKALTTGCNNSAEHSGCGVKTELMDMNTLTWSSGPDFPFVRSS